MPTSSASSPAVAVPQAFGFPWILRRTIGERSTRWFADPATTRNAARAACLTAAVSAIALGQAVGMEWIGPWQAAFAAFGVVSLAVGAVALCWRLDPQAIIARRLVAKAVTRRQALEGALAERRNAQTEATLLAEKHEQARLALETQRTNVRETLDRELAALASCHRKVLEGVAARRKQWQTSSRRFANNWTSASREVDSRYIEMVSQHEQKIQQQVAARLAMVQDEAVTRSLGERKLTPAALPGLGAKLLERLAAEGIVTARDVDPERLAAVEGCGQKKSEMLLAWRAELAAEALTRAPLFLRPEELAAIRAEMTSEIAPIEEAYQRLRSALDTRRAEYTAERKTALDRLAHLEWTAGDAAERESTKLREAHAGRFREAANEALDLAARLRNAFITARDRAGAARHTTADARRAYDEASRRASGRPEARFFGWMIKTFGWRHASVVAPQRVLRSA